MSKYIKVDDLQSYCDNQKDHTITPNDFQRMNQIEIGWHTGTPTEEGLYLTVVKIDDGNGKHCYTYEPVFWKDGWCFRHNTQPIVAWIPITPFEASKEK